MADDSDALAALTQQIANLTASMSTMTTRFDAVDVSLKTIDDRVLEVQARTTALEKRTIGDGLLATPMGQSAPLTNPTLHQQGSHADLDNKPPRFHRLEFQRFDGTEDPWVGSNTVTNFFVGKRHQKVRRFGLPLTISRV
jgi:hypothetical protein